MPYYYDKNHNSEARKAGRPRLENSPLREYWRAAKNKQKLDRENSQE